MISHDIEGVGPRVGIMVAIVATIAGLLAAMVLPPALLADRVVATLGTTLDDVPPLPEDIDRPSENSVILAADGRTKLAELHKVENRVMVPLSEVPRATQNAVIATEDANFWSHSGVNHRAMVRAALANVREGQIEQGASTITQQYIRNRLLTRERTLRRKLTEAVWAIQLERRLSKEQILERYLNTAYFGNGVYGIGTAARHYFSKHVSQLDLDESALLAGMIRAPERNDPIDNPLAAQRRRNIVLDQMAAAGFITRQEAAAARGRPVELEIAPKIETKEPFFVDWVKRILYAEGFDFQPDAQAALGDTKEERQRMVFEGGLVVHTTLDPKVQQIADTTIREHFDDPFNDPLGALVTVEPATGAVVAMAVGPKDYGECEAAPPCEVTQVNPAVPGSGGSGRQPGSSFKPVVVTAALANGITHRWRASTGSGQRIAGCMDGVKPYVVNNYAGSGGGTMDMYQAVKKSNNVYHAKLTAEVGVGEVRKMAHGLGLRHIANIDDFKEKSCSIGLGAASVFPLEMAGAYATLANRGVRCAPFAVSRIEDRAGNLVYQHSDSCERVVDRGLADRVTDILLGPPSSGGTAPIVGERLGRPVAGKTGTTDDWKNAWFVGYVPQYATAAWVGYEIPASMFNVEAKGTVFERVTGGTIPARMWSEYMAAILDGVPVAKFEPPPPPPVTTVPPVVGLTEEEARAALMRKRFRVGVETVRDHRPAGTVVEQNPASGTQAPVGSLVTLSISDGQGPAPVAVPNVVGLLQDDAVARLQEAGFAPWVVTETTTEPSEDGVVLRQNPTGGEERTPGTRVVVTVGDFNGAGPGPGGDEVEPSPGATQGPPGEGRGPDGGGPPGQGGEPPSDDETNAGLVPGSGP